MDASIIVTYRCPMHCKMCNIWDNPTEASREFRPELLEKLPRLSGANVTGGEPFTRTDLGQIVAILFEKTDRVVISTSGYLEDQIFALACKFPRLGFRVSIEGLSTKNDELRGKPGGFDRGLRVLLGLRKLGIRDLGFGTTVSNHNSRDMLWLYELAKQCGFEFASAAFHNSFYFHKFDNKIENVNEVCENFEELVNRLLREPHPKAWFRALFNMGLINYIHGGKRLLPCEAGTENFFVDPYGEVLPCNGMEPALWYESMGNLHDVNDFVQIWEGVKAKSVRERVRTCEKNCWMVGTASPVMKKNLHKIAPWVIAKKAKAMFGKRITVADMPEFFPTLQAPRQDERHHS